MYVGFGEKVYSAGLRMEVVQGPQAPHLGNYIIDWVLPPPSNSLY